MSRTYKQYPIGYYRNPRGYKNAVKNNARRGAIPPNAWDDVETDRAAWLPFEITKKLFESGIDRKTAECKLCKKYRLPKWQAMNLVYEIYSANLNGESPNEEEAVACCYRRSAKIRK